MAEGPLSGAAAVPSSGMIVAIDDAITSIAREEGMARRSQFSAALGFALMMAISTTARADFDMKAGPIWNNDDAKETCPLACSLSPDGDWKTTVPGEMSVCSARNALGYVKRAVPVGPIWNDDEAGRKCRAGLNKIRWNGQWRTTVPGEMSVCGCKGEAR